MSSVHNFFIVEVARYYLYLTDGLQNYCIQCTGGPYLQGSHVKKIHNDLTVRDHPISMYACKGGRGYHYSICPFFNTVCTICFGFHLAKTEYQLFKQVFDLRLGKLSLKEI